MGWMAMVEWPLLLALFLVLVAVVLLLRPRSSDKASSNKKAKGKAKTGDGPTTEDLDKLFRSLGAEEQDHVEGSMIPSEGLILSNAEDPSSFDNELCSGKFLSMHRATHDKKLNKSGEYRYGEYWLDKKRYWEARLQFKFKVPPKQEDLFFGVEIRDFVPMDAVSRSALGVMVTSLRQVVGNQVYHAVGDDPAVVKDGPLERPIFVMPLWAYDQFIVTPEGEEPPNLTDSRFTTFGSKRFKRVKEYRAEIDALNFKVGATYTFCFWGISKFIDKINWKLSVPLNPFPISCNMFCGQPPVQVVMYTLKKSENGDKRHLQARKNYYMNVAFWSSKDRPSWERLDEFFGAKGADLPDWPTSRNASTWSTNNGAPSHLSRTKPEAKGKTSSSWLACCSSR